AVFQGVACDTKIEFCLADTDPDGQPTSGITRTATTQTFTVANNRVKFTSQGGHDAWPRNDYLNFWVCDIAGGILGYAQFPGGPAATDGVVCDYLYTGDIGTATPPYNLGRTATHEVGHWLNLRHIWGDGGCAIDDGVGDTPLAGNPNYTGGACSFPGPNSCGSGPGDSPDMFQNYMDYSDDPCFNMFTQGQANRMRALFEPGGFRSPMLNSSGCCPVTACPRPANVDAFGLTDSSVFVTWDDVATAVSFQLEYRPLGTNTWLTGPTTMDTSLVLTGLELCSTYEVRLASICPSDSGTFCQLKIVETEGCCRAPEDNSVLSFTADSNQVTWEAVFGATQYDLRLRLAGSSDPWTDITTSDTATVVNGLLPCAEYEYQIRPKCDTLGNEFTTLKTFFTAGCEACAEANYCAPASNNSLVFIETFGLGSINQFSGDNGGYGFFANTSDDLLIDSTYSLIFSRGGTFTLPVNWKAWLDLNQDGDFTDPNELIFESGGTNDNLIQGLATIPPNAALGRTRLRIATKYEPNANDPLVSCDTIGAGEYEDYCVNLIAPCRTPENFVAIYDSASSSIFAQWQSAIYNDDFILQYRFLGDTAWTDVTGINGNFFNFIDSTLGGCAEYAFRVRTVCTDVPFSAASEPDTIKTACVVGIDPLLDAAVKLYPNPTEGAWTVEAPQPIQTLEVFDMLGRVRYYRTSDLTKISVKLENLEPAVYLVRVKTAQGETIKRLIYR
ncbi:MAG: GEVED domain-containing protein, partial [Bacteroidota bacterium]